MIEAGNYVNFNKIWTNIGNGFNGDSFITPKNGYYEFTFSCNHKIDSYTNSTGAVWDKIQYL